MGVLLRKTRTNLENLIIRTLVELGGQQQWRSNNVYGRGNAYGCGTQANGFRVSAGGRGRRYDNNYALDDDYDEDFASDDYYSDDIYGEWNGLSEEGNDFEIVWPPMAIIMNTRLDKDYNDKWIGMGNQELLDYFEKYELIRGLHSYGPQGHRGISVLIFESNASGYVNAEFLDKVLAQKGLGRDALDRSRGLFCGFLATKQDLDVFNQYSHGKTRLKFEVRSYREMVVEDVREIYEENQLLKFYKNQKKYFKNENKKLKELVEELDETMGILRDKLRETVEDNRIVRLRTKMQHELIKEEMDSQERFFKESIKQIL